MLTIPKGVDIREFREKMLEKEIREGKISRFLDEFLPLLIHQPDERDEIFYAGCCELKIKPEKAISQAQAFANWLATDFKSHIHEMYLVFDAQTEELIHSERFPEDLPVATREFAKVEIDLAVEFRGHVAEIKALTRYGKEHLDAGIKNGEIRTRPSV